MVFEVLESEFDVYYELNYLLQFDHGSKFNKSKINKNANFSFELILVR